MKSSAHDANMRSEANMEQPEQVGIQFSSEATWETRCPLQGMIPTTILSQMILPGQCNSGVLRFRKATKMGATNYGRGVHLLRYSSQPRHDCRPNAYEIASDFLQESLMTFP